MRGQLLKDDKDISILVLAAGAGKEGPGPLVSMFARRLQADSGHDRARELSTKRQSTPLR